MSELEFIRATYYKGKEVITPSAFSLMVRGYPSFLYTVKKEGLPELATKTGKHDYYYLDELLAWYQVYLAEKTKQAELLAARFVKIQEVNSLKQDSNKASRQALLDSLKK